MTAYVAIPNGDIDQDSPVSQPLMQALRDNPLAMFEGTVGAPRLMDAALDTSAPSAAGSAWVVARTVLLSAGAVGTYAFARGSADAAFGATAAGSTLFPTSAIYSAGYTGSPALNSGTALSGTWRCMGTFDLSSTYSGGGQYNYGATLWLRIA